MGSNPGALHVEGHQGAEFWEALISHVAAAAYKGFTIIDERGDLVQHRTIVEAT